METEIMAIVSQAPALAIVVWLIMRQEKTNTQKNGNGNGANLELVRAISGSMEKLADAQVEANRIHAQRGRSFEKWVDFQQAQMSKPFQSRNQE
jgi:hypothetical protein|tara:strand:- start:17165 stop:17446 length:282 start_codon:yes stop_codon:yes gene_type:complete